MSDACGTENRHPGTLSRCGALSFRHASEDIMKGIVAWLLGVPVVVIVLLYLLDIF